MEDKVASLEAQIQLLSDLHSRVQTLRHIPVVLLKAPMTPLSGQTLQPEFQQVRQVADTIRAEHVQEALRAARDSLGGDGSDLNPNLRREKRKRGRARSPESPEPYVEEKEGTRTLFADDDSHPVEFEGLSKYIREFNRTHSSELHLWRRTRGDEAGGTVLRYRCRDVLTAYVRLVGATGRAVVESVAAFGPRERKSPHSESDFVVYRKLGQEIGRMLESRPGVAVQAVVTLLGAYSTLFVERCTTCQRVLSAEGHVPPVVRVWADGAWSARHAGCAV
ncbi:hypothetical protein H2248_005091 [Termitomyces sp. 'cryptogamus']|nr:hypothetical protein H2248_005091 [Termitomyces sp. 'cryptogamus']